MNEVDASILMAVNLALRRVTKAFDSETVDIINGAINDLRIAGITNLDTGDPLIRRAVVTYVKANSDQYDTQERLQYKASYDEQKAQLQVATGYTEWS